MCSASSLPTPVTLQPKKDLNMTLQSVDVDIITTHIAHLEAEARGHRERALEAGPYPDHEDAK